MKLSSLALISFLAASLAATAATSPERLLSADTWAVFTVPDFQQVKSKRGAWPMVRLWNDPAMKPFRDKFNERFNAQIVTRLEKDLGAKLSDYLALAQGQVTLAVTPGGWDGKSQGTPGFVVIIDAKDKNEALQTQLTQLKKKWVDAGNKVRTEKIRDVEFSGIAISTGKAGKEEAKPEEAEPGEKAATEKKLELLIGQSESLLIVGNYAKDIEKVLVRQSGGAVPSLAEEGTFAASFSSTLRDTLGYGWINLRALVAVATKMAANSSAESGSDFMGMKPDKILGALGLQGLDSAAFGFKEVADGAMLDASLNVPAAKRRGIIKLLTIEPLDANPPPFVPAEALKFRRMRMDIPKLWSNLETMVGEVSPQMAGVFKLLIDNAGKDKDPEFDLRKSVIANLGNDIITYQKAPRVQSLEALSSLPQLWLIGSPQPEQLAAALKAIGSFLPQGAAPKERGFLGRKVYSLSLPAQAEGGRRLDRTLHYAASGSYVALSVDEPMLEEFLRSSASPGKSLRELPGLVAAAEKVGGMGTGLFAYENHRETMRSTFAVIKKESNAMGSLFSNSPLAGKVSNDELKQWFDLSLLPDFDKIAKYFSFTVSALSVNNEGLRLKTFLPHSPQLGK